MPVALPGVFKIYSAGISALPTRANSRLVGLPDMWRVVPKFPASAFIGRERECWQATRDNFGFADNSRTTRRSPRSAILDRDLMKDNTSGESDRVDSLLRQSARPRERFSVIKGYAKTNPRDDANFQSPAIGHGEPLIRVVVGESESRAGSLESRSRVGQAEKRVRERRQARPVAPFELRASEEIEQPWVEFRVLGQGAWRLGAGIDVELGRALVMTKMSREVAQDAEVAVQIAGGPSFKAPPAFVEVRVAYIEIGTEVKGVVIGFDG